MSCVLNRGIGMGGKADAPRQVDDQCSTARHLWLGSGWPSVRSCARKRRLGDAKGGCEAVTLRLTNTWTLTIGHPGMAWK